ncbi:MAG: hypothetical protein AB1938_19035 [Myxococcota bacterium]
MFDDTRLDGKLQELSRELVARPMLPGFNVADAFTMRGMDETGKPGLFAAILLAPGPAPELGALTTFRAVLTQRLKQIDTKTPAWPIVVQGAPEVIDGTNIPGGRDYFEQVKLELRTRQERLVAANRPTPLPAPLDEERSAAPRAAKKPRKVKVARKARAVTARRTVKRVAARTARAGRARRSRR